MSQTLTQLIQTSIQLAREANFLKSYDPITIRDNANGAFISTKFNSFVKVSLKEVSISPKALSNIIRANFTIFERFKHRKVLELVGIEVALNFINHISILLPNFTDMLYDEWNYLSSATLIDRKTERYKQRQLTFLDFMKRSVIPTPDMKMWTFPYNKFGVSIKPKAHNKLFSIFSDVILKEIKLSIHYK
jgi:hypothetical protein